MVSFARTLFAVMLSASAVVCVIVPPPAVAQFREAVSAQTSPATQSAPATNLQDTLYDMSSQAGVIFAGQVLAVRPQLDLAYGSASGWVEIEFRIDQAIRGCVGQATYILREWSGLWSGGNQRYTVGQRLLMMLHTPSDSGLSSPIGGQDGAIPLIGAGAAPRPQDRFTAAAEQAVDLRWIEARLLRATPITSQISHTLHPGLAAQLQPIYAGRERAQAVTTRAARALQSTARSTVRVITPGPTPAGFESTITVPLRSSSVDGQGITLRSVLAMLEAWQAQQSNASH